MLIQQAIIVSTSSNLSDDSLTYLENEHHLILSADGEVSISEYEGGAMTYNNNHHIDKSEMKIILEAINSCFKKESETRPNDYLTNWLLMIDYEDTVVLSLDGAFVDESQIDVVALSDLIREKLDMENLMIFDGGKKRKILTRLQIV